MNTIDGQNCITTVTNVRQRGLQATPSNIQMIVPSNNFSCNGRVTGYLISLESANNSSGGYPSVQVWHPINSTEYTRVDTECALNASDISMMRDRNGHDFYLGNVSCTGNNRIEFQSGDVIGYHQGSPVRYRLWTVQYDGYRAYYHNTSSPLNTFIISNDVRTRNDMIPMIELMYGKINTLTH